MTESLPGHTEYERAMGAPDGTHKPADDAQQGRRLMAVMRYREALNAALREEMAARRVGHAHGRGHRRLQRRVQGHRRAARGVRREARARHADLREHDRRHGRRRGDDRPATRRRAHDDQLLAAGDGPDRQPRGVDPLHVRRPGARCRSWCGCRRAPATSSARRTRTRGRRCYLHVPGPARRRADDGRRRQGPAEVRDPRRQPGHLHRARVPLRPARRGARRRGLHRRLRPGRDPPRGLRRDDRRHLADGADRRPRGEDAEREARHRGRGHRPAHAAPARPRHDPRVGPQDEPLRHRRGGLAARRRRREPRAR